MTAIPEAHAKKAADESSARACIAADLLLIAGLHDHEADHGAIVGLWARCYDGLLQAGPFGSELRGAIARFCQSLTEIPSYVDDATAATLTADFRRIHPAEEPARGARQTRGLEDRAGHTPADVGAVHRWAQRRGHRVEDWRQTAPDQLAMRLRHLAYLVASDGVAAPAAGLHHYLAGQLLDWIDRSVKDMIARSETSLYRDLAVLTAAYAHELERRFGLGLFDSTGSSRPSKDSRRMPMTRQVPVASGTRPQTRC